MKAYFIPAAALSLLLASPAAMAAPSDQNSMTQQDQHKGANPTARQSTGNMGTGAANRHHKVMVKPRVEINRNVIVRRPIDVDRNVRIKRHVDVRTYRRNVHSPRRYHWHVYRRPVGWYAHHWVYGQRLPRAWFVRDYWISDFRMFGLISPPYGYVWVRVGDDALLVDVDTGEVIRVVYDVFY